MPRSKLTALTFPACFFFFPPVLKRFNVLLQWRTFKWLFDSSLCLLCPREVEAFQGGQLSMSPQAAGGVVFLPLGERRPCPRTRCPHRPLSAAAKARGPAAPPNKDAWIRPASDLEMKQGLVNWPHVENKRTQLNESQTYWRLTDLNIHIRGPCWRWSGLCSCGAAGRAPCGIHHCVRLVHQSRDTEMATVCVSWATAHIYYQREQKKICCC